MSAVYETPEERVNRLLLEIKQFKIVDHNHREYCTFEIKRRQTEIEYLLASEAKQEQEQRHDPIAS